MYGVSSHYRRHLFLTRYKLHHRMSNSPDLTQDALREKFCPLHKRGGTFCCRTDLGDFQKSRQSVRAPRYSTQLSVRGTRSW